MRILVVGGYGLVGLAIVRALLARGAQVRGAGRTPAHGARVEPRAQWAALDLARPDKRFDAALEGVDAVINAAGALQDGAGDDLSAVHETGLAALLDACRRHGVTRFVQISAAGAEPDADSAFLRTKAAGDARVRESGLDYAILRPGLVLGPESHGGSTLLRTLAALPVVQPLAHAQAQVHTVALDDVAGEAARFALGERPMEVTLDLAAPRPVTLARLVTKLRAQLGFAPARIVTAPPAFAAIAGAFGDAAAALGWRSPLRSTAMTVMARGVIADPGPHTALGYGPLKGLDATLDTFAGAKQERLYARALPLRVLTTLTLAAFWIASGVIGLVRLDEAAGLLTAAGLGEAIARAFVLAGSVTDIALGLAVLVRRTHALALWGMIAVTLGYLGAASLVVPALWLDPLEPLVKTIPAMTLALAALALREPR
ncbi:MAG: SDR family oxidoreductase [Oceanicaulis sp.]